MCKVISGSDSDSRKTLSFPKIMLSRIYVWHELMVKWCWNMLGKCYLDVAFCFFVQPCLNFGWQIKLPVAVTGVIFSKSMKIERLFQFTLMTCYLP